MKSHKNRIISLIIVSLITTMVWGQQINSRLAFQYYNDQEWEKAAPLFKEMYEGNQVKTYLTYYVRCLMELDEVDEAEKELKKALRRLKDITLNIDLAWVYEMSDQKNLALEYLERPFKSFPTTITGVKVLGNSYISYGKYEQAMKTYEIAGVALNQPEEFHLDLANLYSLMRRHEQMIDEYFALLLTQPRYLNTVQIQLQSALDRDIDKVILDLTRQKTLEYLQQFPGLDIYTEMLIWVSLQEGDFAQAVSQSMALDYRNKEAGNRMIQLARQAREAGAFDPALDAYQYLIDKGLPRDDDDNALIRPAQTPYSLALLEKPQTVLQRLEIEDYQNNQAFESLAKQIEKTIELLPSPTFKAQLFKDLAYLNTYYLFDYHEALLQIDSALSIRGITPVFQADCLLEKGNILLISGDPWAATFIYARVEKENTQNPSGSLAKFRKAQLAYFTGDFRWALSQLDVLKGSTSKLIANDAFELALLIRENQSKADSLNQGLQALSNAEYLRFQNKLDESLMVLDSLIKREDETQVRDDALFRKAEILQSRGFDDDAIPLLQEIVDQYRQDIWGHKALFQLGELHFQHKKFDEAAGYFEELVKYFPNSFYNLDARERIREIRRISQDLIQ